MTIFKTETQNSICMPPQVDTAIHGVPAGLKFVQQVRTEPRVVRRGRRHALRNGLPGHDHHQRGRGCAGRRAAGDVRTGKPVGRRF